MPDDNKKTLKDELSLLMSNMNGVIGEDGNKHFDQGNANLDRVKDRLKDVPDFDDIDRTLKNKSLNVINALFDFYNKFNHINKKDKFYMHRMSLDALNFSNIFYQVKTIKMAINLIMEEMYVSGTDAKLATAMASLQDKFSEAIKAQANYVLFIEDQYKGLVLESENEAQKVLDTSDQTKLIIAGNQTQTEKHIANNSEFFLSTSTKDVIKQIRKEEGIKPNILDENNPLTNPDVKIDLMNELNVELDEEETYHSDSDGLLEII